MIEPGFFHSALFMPYSSYASVHRRRRQARPASDCREVGDGGAPSLLRQHEPAARGGSEPEVCLRESDGGRELGKAQKLRLFDSVAASRQLPSQTYPRSTPEGQGGARASSFGRGGVSSPRWHTG